MKYQTQDLNKYGGHIGSVAKKGMAQERAAWVQAWVKDLMEKGVAASESQACTIIADKVDMSRENIFYYLRLGK